MHSVIDDNDVITGGMVTPQQRRARNAMNRTKTKNSRIYSGYVYIFYYFLLYHNEKMWESRHG